MKAKIITLSTLVGIALSTSKAQAQGEMAPTPTTSSTSIEITPYVGYTFANKFYLTYGGSGKLSDGMSFGGILSVVRGRYNAIEFAYSGQECTGEMDYYDYNTFYSNTTDLFIHYYKLGFTRIAPTGYEKISLFGGIELGAVNYVPKSSEFNSFTEFAVGFQGGTKIFFSERIGIRLQANLNIPLANVGAGIWYSPTSGTSVGLSSSAELLQFAFNGGIIFKIK